MTILASPAHARPAERSAAEDLVLDGEIDSEDLVGRATVGRARAVRASGGDAWISLAGFTQRRPSGEQEVGGLVVVGLPLERITSRVPRTLSAALGASANVPPPAGAAGAALVPTHVTFGEGIIGVTPRLARAAVEAAWRTSGVGGDDARLDSILSRARWSALLPETRLRAARFDDQRLYTDSTADASRLRDSAGANVGLEARLTWRLDRLVYADDEPTFERIRMDRHDARARIAGRVLDALFHWHRAWLDVRSAQMSAREIPEPHLRTTREEAEAALRVMEAEATLDVLTGGWFSSSRSRVPVTRPLAHPPPTVPDAL